MQQYFSFWSVWVIFFSSKVSVTIEKHFSLASVLTSTARKSPHSKIYNQAILKYEASFYSTLCLWKIIFHPAKKVFMWRIENWKSHQHSNYLPSSIWQPSLFGKRPWKKINLPPGQWNNDLSRESSTILAQSTVSIMNLSSFWDVPNKNQTKSHYSPYLENVSG